MMGVDAYIWSNLMTVLLIAGAVYAARVVRAQRLWREAAGELWRRRRSLESLRDLLRPILPVLAAASSFKLVRKLVTQLVTF